MIVLSCASIAAAQSDDYKKFNFFSQSENTRFVFGDLDEGKSPRLKLESKDPSVAQLFGLLDEPGRKTDEGGFFNPDPDAEKRGFNFLFFKTMVKHGFEPGATWQHGSTDPMHFDFVEGWQKLK